MTQLTGPVPMVVRKAITATTATNVSLENKYIKKYRKKCGFRSGTLSLTGPKTDV